MKNDVLLLCTAIKDSHVKNNLIILELEQLSFITY